MKYIIKIRKTGILYIGLMLLLCCTRDEKSTDSAQSKVRFALSMPADFKVSSDNNLYESPPVPFSINLSIDREGKEVYHRKSLMLSNGVDGRFYSKYLPLDEGNAKIKEFYIKDANGKIIYVCPAQGSPMAQYVKDPLPYALQLKSDDIQTIICEVLPFDEKGMRPETFGYAELTVKVPFSFSLAVINQKGENIDSHLKITPSGQESVTLYDKDISKGVQLIVIEKEKAKKYNSFDLILSKDDYETLKLTYEKEKLEDFTYPNIMFANIQQLKIYKGDYYIDSKKDLKKFKERKYEKITGNLNIDYYDPNFTNLNVLESLNYIGGRLIIENTLLKSLEGLKKLISIGEETNLFEEIYDVKEEVRPSLEIRDNSCLESIGSLSSLTTLKNGLFIKNNRKLKTLKGLENLSTIGECYIDLPRVSYSEEEHKKTHLNIFLSFDYIDDEQSFMCPLINYIKNDEPDKKFSKIIIQKFNKVEKEGVFINDLKVSDEYEYNDKEKLIYKYAHKCY